MKKVIATLLAAALIVPGAAQAQNRNSNDRAPAAQQAGKNDNDRGRQQATPPRQQQQQQQAHRFSQGERFDRNRATNYGRVDYRQNRKLSAPGRNQVWVRSGSDALLVLLSNNVIQRVVSGAF